MTLTRHRKQDSTKPRRDPHIEKLRVLSRAGVTVDPSSKRAVQRAYRNYKQTKDMARPVSKKQAAQFKEHGYKTVGKSVIVDGPRDKYRKPIKATQVKALSNGVVKITSKQRRDFIYGFTKKEKKEFAKNPELVTKGILKRLQERFPTLKARKVQTRLQWGSWQATKDFAPSYFTRRYFETKSPEETRKVGKKRATPRIDKLTGLHFVVHTPSKARKRSGKNGRKSK